MSLTCRGPSHDRPLNFLTDSFTFCFGCTAPVGLYYFCGTAGERDRWAWRARKEVPNKEHDPSRVDIRGRASFVACLFCPRGWEQVPEEIMARGERLRARGRGALGDSRAEVGRGLPLRSCRRPSAGTEPHHLQRLRQNLTTSSVLSCQPRR